MIVAGDIRPIVAGPVTRQTAAQRSRGHHGQHRRLSAQAAHAGGNNARIQVAIAELEVRHGQRRARRAKYIIRASAPLVGERTRAGDGHGKSDGAAEEDVLGHRLLRERECGHPCVTRLGVVCA